MPPDIVDSHPAFPPRTPARPLAGLTVLVVEDSRFASEAVRLLCLRSGARLRRADCLRAAERHLCVYRPSILLVDLGLPDGSGLDLIRRLSAGDPRIPAIVATSGDDAALALARAAGADAILPKPLESLGFFQETLLSALPADQRPSMPRAVPQDMVHPDRIALMEDLTRATEAIQRSTAEGEGEGGIDYIARFVSGVALSSHDPDLRQAADRLLRQRAAGHRRPGDLAEVAGILRARLGARPVARGL